MTTIIVAIIACGAGFYYATHYEAVNMAAWLLVERAKSAIFRNK